MKKAIRLVLTAVFISLSCLGGAAALSGDFAGGVKVGTISGLTGKYWVGDNHAVDFTVGSMGLGNFTLDASFLVNQFGLFSSERDDLNRKVSFYYGVGGLAYFPTVGSGSSYGGLKGTLGLVYIFPEPFEIYGEVSPVVMFSTPSVSGILGGIGARYYFGSEKKAAKNGPKAGKPEEKDTKE